MFARVLKTQRERNSIRKPGRKEAMNGRARCSSGFGHGGGVAVLWFSCADFPQGGSFWEGAGGVLRRATLAKNLI